MWSNMKILTVFWSHTGSKVLALFEVTKHSVPTPAGIPQRTPGIIIVPGPAGHDETIEDATTSNNMTLAVVPSTVV